MSISSLIFDLKVVQNNFILNYDNGDDKVMILCFCIDLLLLGFSECSRYPLPPCCATFIVDKLVLNEWNLIEKLKNVDITANADVLDNNFPTAKQFSAFIQSKLEAICRTESNILLISCLKSEKMCSFPLPSLSNAVAT
jgi:hypothetical protein